MLASDAGDRAANEQHAAERTPQKAAAGGAAAGAARNEAREARGGSQEVLSILALLVQEYKY